MPALVEHAWLAPSVPLALAVALWLAGRYLGRLAAWAAMVGPVVVLASGLSALGGTLEAHGATPPAPYVGAVLSEGSVGWLEQGAVVLRMGFAVDGLAALMLAVVGSVSLMVMLFSVGYMREERDYNRYFALLSLFTAAMTGLVIADTLVGVFVAWELVGVCSYLLIGFWYEKPAASAAAVKAFLVTRVGDVGFLLGLAILWQGTGHFGLVEVAAALPDLPAGTLGLAAGLVFMGAAGKSAQFPLHVWLPDAMEGPTPVSALIHAATMVAAGVFLVARVWPLFEAAPGVLALMLALGAITALGAATVAITQRDIKKVLAYSTISQLGFMFAALGAGAWRVAIFHLVTHAAFKALLFLASGSVIHGCGTQDMHEMGGLARSMPITATTWVVGILALAGIPPLAGFFSKDEVVASVMHASPLAAVALVIASAFTAAYAARATRMTFFGEKRGDGHAHESGLAMIVPLLVLSVGALGLGAFGHQVVEVLGGEAEPLNAAVAAVSIAVALAGLGVGWMVFRSGSPSDERVSSALGGVWRAWGKAYGWDALVERSFVAPTIRSAEAFYQVFDRLAIDGVAVEGTGGLARRLGAWLARLQYGDLQWYVALLGGGVILVFATVSYYASKVLD